MTEPARPLSLLYDPEWGIERLPDGGTVRIRPVEAGEVALQLDWFNRLSKESRRLRFFGPKPSLSPADISRLTDLDGWRQHALVALVSERFGGERPAAIARFVRDAERRNEAEMALAVVDTHQGRGLGSRLLGRLAASARHRGVDWLLGEVLSENLRMRGVLRQFAPHVRREALGITGRYRIDLQAWAEQALGCPRTPRRRSTTLS